MSRASNIAIRSWRGPRHDPARQVPFFNGLLGAEGPSHDPSGVLPRNPNRVLRVRLQRCLWNQAVAIRGRKFGIARPIGRREMAGNLVLSIEQAHGQFAAILAKTRSPDLERDGVSELVLILCG